MNPPLPNSQTSPNIVNKGLRVWTVVLVLAVILGLVVGSTYNGLVTSDQKVQSQWAQVQNVYQRRLDLVPNLVETVKGAANFEKSTFQAVTEARAKAEGALSNASSNPANDPAKLAQVQQTQGELSSALSRLMVVVENYPDLKATANFRDLQSQLEGTENRIAVERMRFNETAQTFNAKRLSFPTTIIAGMFGSRFNEKAYFKADEGAQNAPKVKFGN
jgi:LemA protein